MRCTFADRWSLQNILKHAAGEYCVEILQHLYYEMFPLLVRQQKLS